MTIAIAGGSGFIGSYLKKHLQDLGHELTIIRHQQIFDDTFPLQKILNQAEVLINLAGAPIVKRWTKKYKETIFNSRIMTTRRLLQAINPESTKLIINASAIGIYSQTGIHTESSTDYADDFLAHTCKAWEAEAQRLSDKVRTVIFRFGLVLGQGGALKKMLPVFRLGLGGMIGHGKQIYSWVDVHDVVRAIEFVMNNQQCCGIYNLTSPNPVSNKEFTTTLGNILKKPTFFRIPASFIKIIYGQAAITLTGGQYVLPQRLLECGFKFTFDDLKKSLDTILKK